MTTAAARALDCASIAAAIHDAAVTDVRAFKPGNVSAASPGHDMNAQDFVTSADAAAAVIAQPGLTIGERILRAIEATREVVAFNTNLGIVLLCAPLAHAAVEPLAERSLRDRVAAGLRTMTVTDAELAYRAIRLARPGGLGHSERHDVFDAPSVSLLEAMREAAGRDRIAYQYVTDFRDVFESGVPAARTALASGYSAEWAAVAVYLVFLSRFPDSHVGRKHGLEIAREVIREAQTAATALEAAAGPQQAMPLLEDLDRRLKSRGINPGTSADMTVASLVAAA
ncbi:MAG: triphosphoribosyl-dephospho-CoA synthase, partial [Burkholderiales bacterium]